MQLIIIRHGDPDYKHDTLTERGWKEAEALSERMAVIPATAYYVSPLGRARDTASLTLKKVGKEATVLPWLTEFTHPVKKPHPAVSPHIPWNWIPEDWSERKEFYDNEEWFKAPEMVEGNIKEAYDEVTTGLDKLLASYGYERNGHTYKPVRPNHDIVVLFCHFGVEGVLLSHLLNASPMIVWHGCIAETTGVTTLATEEREKGCAIWRMLSFSDLSHLSAKGITPSFAGRFDEVYGDNSEG